MRHSATRAILERDDVIIVASVSCIYGIGAVETYSGTAVTHRARRQDRPHGIDARACRRCNTGAMTTISCAAPFACAATPSTFSRRITKTAPGASSCSAMMVDTHHRIRSADRARSAGALDTIKVYANSHYVTPRPTLAQAMKGIKAGAASCGSTEFRAKGKLLEAQRLEQRTHVRSGDDRGDGLLRRHRELFALADRAQAGRAAADPVRISARRGAGVLRRKPCHACRRSARMYQRRLSPQIHAGGIRLPPALLHRQPAAEIRGMGRDAARRSVYVSATPGPMGDGAHRRRLHRAGDPAHRADRSAGGNSPRRNARWTI